MQFSFQSIFCTLSWNVWSFTTVSLHVLEYTILIDFSHVNTQVERDDYRGDPLYSRIHKSSSSSTLPSVKSQGKVGVNIQFMHLVSNKFVCDWIIQYWIATMQYLYLLLQCSTYITLMYLYVLDICCLKFTVPNVHHYKRDILNGNESFFTTCILFSD